MTMVTATGIVAMTATKSMAWRSRMATAMGPIMAKMTVIIGAITITNIQVIIAMRFVAIALSTATESSTGRRTVTVIGAATTNAIVELAIRQGIQADLLSSIGLKALP